MKKNKLLFSILILIIVAVAFIACTNTTTHTVVFELNGGQANFELVNTVEHNATIVRPSPNPIKDGYRFIEWREGGIAFDFTTPITRNIVLVAHFEPLVEQNQTVTVFFNLDGGTADFNLQQQIAVGSTITRPIEDPIRYGYIFMGWYVDGNQFEFTTTITTNITITAVWVQRTATSLMVVARPNLTRYYFRDTQVDLSGGVIRVAFNNDTSIDVSMTAQGVNVDFDFENVTFSSTPGFNDVVVSGITDITIEYLGVSTSFDVTVILNYHANNGLIGFLFDHAFGALNRFDDLLILYTHHLLSQELFYIRLSNSETWNTGWDNVFAPHFAIIDDIVTEFFFEYYPFLLEDPQIWNFIVTLGSARFKNLAIGFEPGEVEYYSHKIREMYFAFNYAQRVNVLTAINTSGMHFINQLVTYYRSHFGLGVAHIDAFRQMLTAQFYHDFYVATENYNMLALFMHSFEDFLDIFGSLNAEHTNIFNTHWGVERQVLNAFHNARYIHPPEGFDWANFRILSRELVNRNASEDHILYLYFLFEFLDLVDYINQSGNQEWIQHLEEVYASDINHARSFLTTQIMADIPLVFNDENAFAFVRMLSRAAIIHTTQGINNFGISNFTPIINAMWDYYSLIESATKAQLLRLNSFSFYFIDITVSFSVLSSRVPMAISTLVRATLEADIFLNSYRVNGIVRDFNDFVASIRVAMRVYRHHRGLGQFDYYFGDMFDYLKDYYFDRHQPRISDDILRIVDFMFDARLHLLNGRDVHFFYLYFTVRDLVEDILSSEDNNLIYEFTELLLFGTQTNPVSAHQMFINWQNEYFGFFVSEFEEFSQENFLEFIFAYSRVVFNRMTFSNVYWLTPQAEVDVELMIKLFNQLTTEQRVVFLWGGIFAVLPPYALYMELTAEHFAKTISQAAAQVYVFLWEAFVWYDRWNVEQNLAHFNNVMTIFRLHLIPSYNALSNDDRIAFNALFYDWYQEALELYASLIVSAVNWESIEQMMLGALRNIGDNGSDLLFLHFWFTIYFEYTMIRYNPEIYLEFNERFATQFATISAHRDTFNDLIFSSTNLIAFARRLSTIAFRLAYDPGYIIAIGTPGNAFRSDAMVARQLFLALNYNLVAAFFNSVDSALEYFIYWTLAEVRQTWPTTGMAPAPAAFSLAYESLVRAFIQYSFYQAGEQAAHARFIYYMNITLQRFYSLPTTGIGSQATFNSNVTFGPLFTYLRVAMLP
ncbi:MAG: InlB B-repeat-containing protein [Firmicutes bacterium]|nr:InlB B-repeat-containing protein [Bacillota bacterium]